jgi:hypothetical protein
VSAPRLDGDCLAEREVAMIEKAALHVGMKSLMNHGAASCVYSEGCNGVTQEHLIAFAREVALHCAAALATSEPAPHEPAMLQGVEALLNEAYAHWDADREFKVGKILLALIGHNKGYDKRSDAFRAALSASKQGGKAEGWMPIEMAPVGREMFMARAFDVEIGKGQRYTSDPYCVWQEPAGSFVRWPHKSIPPTHFTRIPPAPAAQPQGDKS